MTLTADLPALRLGILGGTGEQGRGLARRFARVGHQVVLGSRDPDRAAAAARELSSGRRKLPVTGATNAAAASAADIVIVAVPYAGHRELLALLAPVLAGKVVVDCVNPMRFERGRPTMVDVPEGSAAQQAAAVLPDSTVVSAFHDVSATLLLGPLPSVRTDVLVCGDDADAKLLVCSLASQIRGLRGIDVGPLALSSVLESLTMVLIGVNKRYQTHAGVRVTGV